ncbi:hypothetical protein FQN54_001739 [Arachnomyces sp. PD_36]|nr:hypothetical protein FQN54_001739 [Arachnomyces sp. PD_36]
METSPKNEQGSAAQMCPPLEHITLDLQICEDAEELAIHNKAGEINRELVQHTELSAKVHVKTTLQHVRYGTVQSESAALLVFRSHFFHPNASGSNRIKSAIIRLSFTHATTPDDLTKAPRVLKMFPLHATDSRENVRTVTNELGVNLNLGTRSRLPSMQSTQTTSSDRRRYAEINGIVTTTKRRQHPRAENRAVWTIDEDNVARDGIPRFFEGAVILQCAQDSFHMAIDVETRQGLLPDTVELLRKSVREEDDPVVFVPGKLHSIEPKNIPEVFDGNMLAGLVDMSPHMVHHH